jgi:hypothetical protein
MHWSWQQLQDLPEDVYAVLVAELSEAERRVNL